MNDIPEKQEQRIQIKEGETITVNLGTDDDKKEIKIGAELSNDERKQLCMLLRNEDGY